MLFALLFSLLSLSPAAFAEIPQDALPQGNCRPLPLHANQEGAVVGISAVRCHSLYGDTDLFEITAPDLGGKTEIYFYDRNETYEFERRVTGSVVNSLRELGYRDGGIFSLERVSDGRLHLLVSLKSVGRHREPVEIYVKAGGRQAEGILFPELD